MLTRQRQPNKGLFPVLWCLSELLAKVTQRALEFVPPLPSRKLTRHQPSPPRKPRVSGGGAGVRGAPENPRAGSKLETMGCVPSSSEAAVNLMRRIRARMALHDWTCRTVRRRCGFVRRCSTRAGPEGTLVSPSPAAALRVDSTVHGHAALATCMSRRQS